MSSEIDRRMPPELWEQVFEPLPATEILNPVALASQTLQVHGAAYLSRQLTQTSLSQLFCNTRLRDLFFRVLCASQTGPSVKSLDFTGIQNDLPLYFIRIASNLTRLTYHGNSLSDQDFKRLQAAAEEKKLKHLELLDLSLVEEHESSHGGRAIHAITQTALRLHMLILKNIHVSLSFCPPTQLRVLALENAGINLTGIKALLSSESPRQLTLLDLSRNESIDANMVSALLLSGVALENLEILKLRDTGSQNPLINLAVYKEGYPLQKLKVLDLGHIRFTPTQKGYLIDIFNRLPSLERLVLTDFNEAEIDQIDPEVGIYMNQKNPYT